jgi:uncharacterized membrane protein YhdT
VYLIRIGMEPMNCRTCLCQISRKTLQSVFSPTVLRLHVSLVIEWLVHNSLQSETQRDVLLSGWYMAACSLRHRGMYYWVAGTWQPAVWDTEGCIIEWLVHDSMQSETQRDVLLSGWYMTACSLRHTGMYYWVAGSWQPAVWDTEGCVIEWLVHDSLQSETQRDVLLSRWYMTACSLRLRGMCYWVAGTWQPAVWDTEGCVALALGHFTTPTRFFTKRSFFRLKRFDNTNSASPSYTLFLVCGEMPHYFSHAFEAMLPWFNCCNFRAPGAALDVHRTQSSWTARLLHVMRFRIQTTHRPVNCSVMLPGANSNLWEQTCWLLTLNALFYMIYNDSNVEVN